MRERKRESLKERDMERVHRDKSGEREERVEMEQEGKGARE